ncbi:FdhF/YdeP family oxidoreductase [Kineosporia sp. NBRC 101731]|uniref:FdhF/YdeP family oxidoreductase n=1 Tax=Kineosporia sp. NBRC 101731 TaxID=3032199 RepID=UPI0024A1B235|nr:FdhF/YdeP family oxidoreductase [Kineosporia sp. NBRC 101731]GLY27628.1 formate dehydrogenase [Kineosporia sp. NBRC 101731]
MSRAPREDFDESDVQVGHSKDSAAGVPGVYHALKKSYEQMGATRTTRTLLKLNQKDGFDCPGCAWPEKDHRHVAEFCENGAKAVAEEATKRTIGADFFARHAVSELDQKTDWWLGQQGRLTEPLIKPAGQDHYVPISWDSAFDLIATELRGLDSPNRATFYTSGRTSNEAAFVYQLMVRALGTNNLPDCSNMCHESSGSALTEAIGVGKGSVQIDDLEQADLIVVMGQNPGTNHPRMLATLEAAKQNGAVIVAVNPLPEAGLINFRNPQTPKGVVGSGTPLADDFLQIRIGGDQALLMAVAQILLQHDEVIDHAFIAEHTAGFDEYAAHIKGLDLAELVRATGLTQSQVRDLADRFLASRKTIVCWAMGITQHKHSVPTIHEIVNVLMIQGNLGRPGAGVCPVRGHSNVQGDRTMGIFEKMPEWFLDNLQQEFGFEPPRQHGFDVVDSLRAMRDGEIDVFMAVGGNFVRATPDSNLTEAALRQCRLTVQVSTKLNRSHTVCGETALILPTLGRTDRDRQASGDQKVSVEDSMSRVHGSRGHLKPPSDQLLSEVAIVTRLARRAVGDRVDVPWDDFEADYSTIRDRISRVVPGFDDYETKLADPKGFTLPHATRSRRFPTKTGRANFTACPLEYPKIPEGRLLLQTLRSHDQYNTTIYGLDDRYRGVTGGRRVVFVNADDLRTLGLADGEMVDLVSEWVDGVDRRAENFRIVQYDTAKGCAAAYYPETNVLVPLDSVADTSNTPTSKSVIVRLEKV